MRYDALIIGAGMSGLAAAIRLAMFDRRVLVLERHEVWGGLNSFYSLGGRRFDVGLHALTNFAARGERGVPLTKVLRQLRIRHADLKLGEQNHSEIRLPGLVLRFTNQFEFFEAEVLRAFPGEADGFAKLVQAVREHELREEGVPLTGNARQGAREVLENFLSEPYLIDALLLPTLYYGSAREDDVDWYQFVVLFRSIFFEGFARPEGGIRPLINLMIKRLKAVGAEIRVRAGVRRILVADGAARGVELDDGEIIEADQVFSSAGFVETMQLCGEETERQRVRPADHGRLSFIESISVLDELPTELGYDAATSFFSTGERFRYRRPDELVDVHSGVLSSPNNFAAEKPPTEGMMRLTVLANHDRWCALPEAEYVAAKRELADAAIEEATKYYTDWRPHTVFRDVFTPRTIRHFTGHEAGNVYGSPRKRLDGRTGIDGLHLIGTDQGYLGVVGAMVSGVSMANLHALARV